MPISLRIEVDGDDNGGAGNTTIINNSPTITATTGTNEMGYGVLAGDIDGSNNIFTVPQGEFKSGSAKVYTGDSMVRVIFTEDPTNGTVTLNFNPTERVTVDYETVI